jgi:DNA-binding transcriptional regulator GbsR (MarR family)
VKRKKMIEDSYLAYFDSLTASEQENIRNDKDLQKAVEEKRKEIEKFYKDLADYYKAKERRDYFTLI